MYRRKGNKISSFKNHAIRDNYCCQFELLLWNLYLIFINNGLTLHCSETSQTECFSVSAHFGVCYLILFSYIKCVMTQMPTYF